MFRILLTFTPAVILQGCIAAPFLAAGSSRTPDGIFVAKRTVDQVRRCLVHAHGAGREVAEGGTIQWRELTFSDSTSRVIFFYILRPVSGGAMVQVKQTGGLAADSKQGRRCYRR